MMKARVASNQMARKRGLLMGSGTITVQGSIRLRQGAHIPVAGRWSFMQLP